MIHFGFQPVDGEVDFALLFAFRWPELRLKGQDSLAALLVLRGDVHDEGGTNVGIGNGIENLEGAVGFAFDGPLLKSCEKAALIAQRRGVVAAGVWGVEGRTDVVVCPLWRGAGENRTGTNACPTGMCYGFRFVDYGIQPKIERVVARASCPCDWGREAPGAGGSSAAGGRGCRRRHPLPYFSAGGAVGCR